MKHAASRALIVCAFLGLLTACGGGGTSTDNGGDDPIDPPPTIKPPVITAQPENFTAQPGESATFDVTATGEGTLAYQWQLSTNSGSTWSDIGLATADTYVTPVLDASDDGNQYRCAVSNAGGTTNSDAATVTVGSAPAWSHTIVIDGIPDFTPEEEFGTTTPGTSGFITWDENFVYVGFDAPEIATNSTTNWFTIYFSGLAGTTTGVTYNTQQPALPFQARYHVQWRSDDGMTDALQYNGASWVSAGWDFTGDVAQIGTYVEMRIDRTDLGAPSMLAVHLALVDETASAEWTAGGVPSTTFTDGVDPDYTAYFDFDLTAAEAPNTYAPLP